MIDLKQDLCIPAQVPTQVGTGNGHLINGEKGCNRKWSPDQWRHEQVPFPRLRCCWSIRSSDSAATLTRYFVYCYFRSCYHHFRSGQDRGPCGEGCARTLGWTWGCRAPSWGSRCCQGYRGRRRAAILEFCQTGDRWRSRISSPKTYGRSSWWSPWWSLWFCKEFKEAFRTRSSYSKHLNTRHVLVLYSCHGHDFLMSLKCVWWLRGMKLY